MFNPLAMMGPPPSDKFIYSRHLGWKEYDEDGDQVPAMIAVVDGGIGYNVFRIGEQCYHLEWFGCKEDAIDWAVDRCRSEVSEHELRQSERD